jgi:hypothetical protein
MRLRKGRVGHTLPANDTVRVWLWQTLADLGIHQQTILNVEAT